MKNRQVIGALLATGALMFAIAGAAIADTPSNGATSNLQGDAGDYTNVLIDSKANTGQDTVLFCDGATATEFTSHISFDLSTTAPAGSYFRVYLTPNGGATLSPSGVDITQNQGTISTAGLTAGNHSLAIDLQVTTSFGITSGGVLLVIADDVNGQVVTQFHSKSNSLNCTEASPSPTPTVAPTPTPTVAPTPTPTVAPTPTPTVAPTPTPTVAPTPTPTVAPTPTPTVAPTPTPTVAPTPTPTVAPSQTPTGGGGGGGGGGNSPEPTLPPTLALGGQSNQTNSSWMFVVALGMLIGSVLVLSPIKVRNRR